MLIDHSSCFVEKSVLKANQSAGILSGPKPSAKDLTGDVPRNQSSADMSEASGHYRVCFVGIYYLLNYHLIGSFIRFEIFLFIYLFQTLFIIQCFYFLHQDSINSIFCTLLCPTTVIKDNLLTIISKNYYVM